MRGRRFSPRKSSTARSRTVTNAPVRFLGSDLGSHTITMLSVIAWRVVGHTLRRDPCFWGHASHRCGIPDFDAHWWCVPESTAGHWPSPRWRDSSATPDRIVTFHFDHARRPPSARAPDPSLPISPQAGRRGADGCFRRPIRPRGNVRNVRNVSGNLFVDSEMQSNAGRSAPTDRCAAVGLPRRCRGHHRVVTALQIAAVCGNFPASFRSRYAGVTSRTAGRWRRTNVRQRSPWWPRTSRDHASCDARHPA